MKKKFKVHYSFYLSDYIEVEAENEQQAESIVDDMICCGEIGNLNEMDIGDSKIWID
jgi:hypothetical protein